MKDPSPVYSPALPLPSHGYVRSFEAKIDYLEDETLRIRGVQTDHQHRLEYDWLVRFPDYTILAASARQPAGEPTVLAPQLLSRCRSLQGAQTNQGLSKAARSLFGELPGHRQHLALAIDMARVSLQAFPVPQGDHERFAAAAADLPPGPSRVARMAWERDRVEWPWICNSCYAYRDESVALFEQGRSAASISTWPHPSPAKSGFSGAPSGCVLPSVRTARALRVTTTWTIPSTNSGCRLTSRPTARSVRRPAAGSGWPTSAFARAARPARRA